jgi:ABC-2 type transport system ATP-binding protein
MMALGTPGELKARVDRRVRLELLVQPAARAEAEAMLPGQRLDTVLGTLGLEQLDDFRILTPSLEDVYLQLGGGERLTAEAAAD